MFSRYLRWLGSKPLLADVGVGSLTFAFGLQLLRVLVPGMFWILGDRMGLNSILLGLIGLAIFLTAFLAIPLEKMLGKWRLVIIAAAGIPVTRLYVQLWWGEPLFNLCVAIIGTMLFFIFIVAWQRITRRASYFVLGILGGFLLDSAMTGIFATYDPIWQAKLAPILLTMMLVLAQFLLLFGIRVEDKTTEDRVVIGPKEGRIGAVSFRSYALLAIGPFLFLELIIFQNIPRLAAITDWQLPTAFTVVLGAQIIALTIVVWFLTRLKTLSWFWGLFMGVVLTVSLVFTQQKIALLAGLFLLLGQVLACALIAIILARTPREDSRTSIASATGILLLLIFVFAYYSVYDMKLLYSNAILEPLAGGAIAICAVASLLSNGWRLEGERELWLAPAFALLLLLLPVANYLTWERPEPVQGNGYPIRVMTYNLHNGFNTKGHLDLEQIATVIEHSNPDIVALQEVSRGWLVSGRVDMLSWLSQRLKMPYVFGPTADPFWGNAVLSRYPIIAFSKHELPTRDLFIRRGFVVALIDLGGGDTIKVIGTHFHHLEGGTAIRQLQSQAIVSFWNGLDRTVIMGDFNAEPDSSEINILRRAGLVDAAKLMFIAPPLTFSSDAPARRIDYIWISSDLQVLDVLVPQSLASDHLPVVATVTTQK